MNILITGGTGLIGRALAGELARAGHRICVLTRNPHKAKALLPIGTQILAWEAVSAPGWESAVAKADAIINLAGESIAGEGLAAILTRRWTPEVKKRIQESRVRVGKLLTQAIQLSTSKPAVLIQASAVGYYGSISDREVTEEDPPGDDFLARVCRQWEASTTEVGAMGVRRVVIRTGLVLARQGGILPLMLLPVRLFVGGPLGNGQQAIPWIHLADEVTAIRFLLENEGAHGAYNLVAPSPVSQAEFVRTAGAVLRRPAFIPTPAGLLKLALGEKADLVLEGQRAVPRRLLEAGFTFHFKDLESALRDLTG